MKVTYTDEQKQEFIEAALEVGITPAMRQLGFPGSHHTAQRWFNENNLNLPDVNYLQKQAAALKKYYSDDEQLVAVQIVIDSILEQLGRSDNDAESINKLTNAYYKAIQTFNLIKGKATNINDNNIKDSSDLAIRDLINEQKAKNKLMEGNSTNNFVNSK